MQFYRNTICQDYQDLYGLSQHFYSSLDMKENK